MCLKSANSNQLTIQNEVEGHPLSQRFSQNIPLHVNSNGQCCPQNIKMCEFSYTKYHRIVGNVLKKNPKIQGKSNIFFFCLLAPMRKNLYQSLSFMFSMWTSEPKQLADSQWDLQS